MLDKKFYYIFEINNKSHFKIDSFGFWVEKIYIFRILPINKKKLCGESIVRVYVKYFFKIFELSIDSNIYFHQPRWLQKNYLKNNKYKIKLFISSNYWKINVNQDIDIKNNCFNDYFENRIEALKK